MQYRSKTLFPAGAKALYFALGLAMLTVSAVAQEAYTREALVQAMTTLSPEALDAQLKARGLAFEPEAEDLPKLFGAAKIPPSKLPGLIVFLRAAIPTPIPAEQALPLAERILQDLATAGPMDLAPLEHLHPLLLEDKGKVDSVFDPTRYKTHSLGKLLNLPGSSRVAGALFVFTTDGIEKLYYAEFAPNKDGKLLLRDLIESNAQLATQHLGAELDLAETRLKEIYRSEYDKQGEVARNVMTEDLVKSLEAIGGWSRIVRGERVAQAALKIEPQASIDMKSIRPVLHVSHSAAGKQVEYYADFERIGDDLRIVRLRDATGGRDIGADPNLDLYLCRRYESSGCGTYEMARTEMPEYATVAQLLSMGEAALQDFQGERLKAIAEELRVMSDENAALGTSYLATAAFLSFDYVKAEEMARQAIMGGGAFYVPVLHYFSGGMRDPWLGRAVIGISGQGLEYKPSAEITEYAQMTVPWTNVREVQVAPKVKSLIPGMGSGQYPGIGLKVEIPKLNKPGKMNRKSWNFFLFPAGCVSHSTQIRDDMTPWFNPNPCMNTPSIFNYGESKGKGVVMVPMAPGKKKMFPGTGQSAGPATMLMVQRTWQPAAAMLQRVIQTAQ